MTEKILLDTDIGTNIDDALCLAYLLAQPDCELLGITTVSGEAVRRAAVASAIVQAAGAKIPIYPGVETPLFIPSQQPAAQQAERLSNWPHETMFPTGEAVDFMRRTIRANPGDITLVAIGPLTNIGLLFAIDPAAALLIKRLVIMGGHYVHWDADIPLTERNLRGDPHAADLVFRSAAHIWAVGQGVTHNLVLPADDVRAQLQTARLQPVLDFAEVWFTQRDSVTFHDPLAAAIIFAHDLCTFERGEVTVEMRGERLRGFTHWKPDTQGRHHVAQHAEPAAFFDHLFGVLNDA